METTDESKDNDKEFLEQLEHRLNVSRQQRIEIEEANEKLRKKLEKLRAQVDELDLKYAKKETESVENDESRNQENKEPISETVSTQIEISSTNTTTEKLNE